MRNTEMHASGWNRLLGTGLVCLSLLAFEILSTRLLGVILEGHLVIFAIALAMLGMGAATSLSSLGRLGVKYSASPLVLSYWSTALGLCYLFSLSVLTLANDISNDAVERAIDTGGLDALVLTIRSSMFDKIMLAGTILFWPYFIFGIFIAKLFKSTSRVEYHRLYATDLVGASLGCVLAIVFLDFLGYAGCLSLILISTFLGAAAFCGTYSRFALASNLGLAVIGTLAATSPTIRSHLEPRPPLDQLARNYDRTNEVTEVWHVWNAHSRVALLSMRNKQSGEIRQVYAHENGSGWAWVPGKSSDKLSKLATMFNPKRVLVLFAGVGADMIEIDRLCGGMCEITGVEINRHMVEHALAQGSQELRSFLSKPGITLEVAEAREYLERDQDRYDVILLSWWGAGTSHYVGTSGKLAEYLYTQEAYGSLLDHLNPSGILILFNSSKAQSLVNFRKVFQDRGLGGLAGRVVVLKSQGSEFVSAGGLVVRRNQKSDSVSDRLQFYDILEDMRLIIKPSGFSTSEMNVVRRVAKDLDTRLILSPDGVDPAYAVYGEIVNGVNLDTINKRLIASYGTELSIVTDDRPFINELVPRAYYLDIDKWLGSNQDSRLWRTTRAFLSFVICLCIVSSVLIFGPLLARSGPDLSSRNITELLYFMSLGAGFILIEVGLIRKLGLLLGHPAYSISIVLASLIFSTGLGALSSNWLFRSGTLTAKRVALLIIVYVVLASALYGALTYAVITLPLIVKSVIVVLFLCPLGFLMGQLFPQGLARVGEQDYRLVPWAWAINSTASTISVGIAYLLSYPLGFSALLYAGAAVYAVIIFLPLSKAANRACATPTATPARGEISAPR